MNPGPIGIPSPGRTASRSSPRWSPWSRGATPSGRPDSSQTAVVGAGNGNTPSRNSGSGWTGRTRHHRARPARSGTATVVGPQVPGADREVPVSTPGRCGGCVRPPCSAAASAPPAGRVKPSSIHRCRAAAGDAPGGVAVERVGVLVRRSRTPSRRSPPGVLVVVDLRPRPGDVSDQRHLVELRARCVLGRAKNGASGRDQEWTLAPDLDRQVQWLFEDSADGTRLGE